MLAYGGQRREMGRVRFFFLLPWESEHGDTLPKPQPWPGTLSSLWVSGPLFFLGGWDYSWWPVSHRCVGFWSNLFTWKSQWRKQFCFDRSKTNVTLRLHFCCLFFIVVNKTTYAIQELKSLHTVHIYFLFLGSSKSSWDKSTMLVSFLHQLFLPIFCLFGKCSVNYFYYYLKNC